MKPDSGKRDNGAPCMDGTTGMAWSVLTEIGQMLRTLAEKGEAGSIDLRSIPMTDADRDHLEEILGRGEVRAELDLAGASEVWETAYAGVWWIRHKGAGSKIACEEIAVTCIPEILLTHPVDIEAAAARLSNDLVQDLSSRHLHAQDPENELEASNV
jgi:hydrogenase-1 operon protein HyaF